MERAIKSYLIEKKNSNHSTIGYMSIVDGTNLWNYTTIKTEVILRNSEIWDYTYVSHGSNISFTKIGKFCSIWQNFKAWLWKHPTNFVSTHPAFVSIAKQCWFTFADKNYFQERDVITIGNDVWIWTNVTILDGVTIWDGAILWAWCIVTNNVEPYSIVVGIPAKTLRFRFDESDINFLMEFKWWDKDVEWIQKYYKDFHDIKVFIKNYKHS